MSPILGRRSYRSTLVYRDGEVGINRITINRITKRLHFLFPPFFSNRPLSFGGKDGCSGVILRNALFNLRFCAT